MATGISEYNLIIYFINYYFLCEEEDIIILSYEKFLLHLLFHLNIL